MLASTINSSSSNTPLPKWYPKWRGKPIYNGNPEALAYCFDGIGRSVAFIGIGAFFGSALLRIAKESVGCPTEPPEGFTHIPDCDERVLGIKPSSLLTTYTMIVGVTSAALLPLMGAVIDHTSLRLFFGRVTSTLFVVSIIPQIFLNEQNFTVMAVIQLLSAFIGWAQTELTYAYLPELTDDEDLLNDYTKSYTIAFFSTSILYLLAVIGSVTAAGYGDDDIVTNRIGVIVAVAINIVLLPLAWGYLFQKREKAHELPENTSIWTAGFIQLYNTGKNIASNYNALKWFYLAIAMSDSGIQALTTIAVTYMSDKLQLNARENGIAICIILLGCVPGAMISNYITKRWDPIVSSIVALVVLIVATAFYAIFLVGPNQQLETYIISFFWGMGTGWKWTVDRLLASLIIPEGQDAELMGFFLFSGQILSWIPPLIYTAMNEAGISQRIGIATLDVYFLLSILCYFLMGGYQQARIQVGRTTTFSAGNSTTDTRGEEDQDDTGKSTEEPDC